MEVFNMDNMVEIIKEARKAGMQTALILFAALCVVAGLFAFYIYQSYKSTPVTSTVTQLQDGEHNSQRLTNG